MVLWVKRAINPSRECNLVERYLIISYSEHELLWTDSRYSSTQCTWKTNIYPRISFWFRSDISGAIASYYIQNTPEPVVIKYIIVFTVSLCIYKISTVAKNYWQSRSQKVFKKKNDWEKSLWLNSLPRYLGCLWRLWRTKTTEASGSVFLFGPGWSRQ